MATLVTGNMVTDRSINTADIAIESIGVSQLSAGAVTTKLGSEIGSFMFRNKVINGDMRIDQRNAGTAVSSINNIRKYTVDRMAVDLVGTGNITSQQVTDAPTGFQYSSRLTLTTPNTNPIGLDRAYFMHVIEGSNIANVGFNKSWCKFQILTFWVKSSVVGKYTVTFFYGSNNERRHILPYTINISNTWELKTLILPPDTNSGVDPNITNSVGLIMSWALGGSSFYQTGATSNTWYTIVGADGPWMLSDAVKWFSSSAGATWQIAGIQLEEGIYATPFEQRPIGTELALCQRYYQKSYQQNVIPGSASYDTPGHPNTFGTGTGICGIEFPVVMRTSPAVSIYRPSTGNINQIENYVQTGARTVTTIEKYSGGIGLILVDANVDNNFIQWHYTADAEF